MNRSCRQARSRIPLPVRYTCFLACLLWLPAVHASVCNPEDFHGTYGFLLTGQANIGAGWQTAASVGQLVLDGSGNLSGVASVNFTGLYLGNPVTGTYEAHTDCTVVWNLQDDSGNFQHFQGTMSEDGRRVSFHQSDPGGARDGTMFRMASDCPVQSFRGRYRVRVSGATIDVQTGQVSGAISTEGLLEADGAGELAFAPGASSALLAAGTYDFEDGCFLHMAVELPAGGNETPVLNFRAVLAADGTAVVGVQSDPGTAVVLRLTAR